MTQPMQGTVIPRFDPKDVQDHKLMAALSYLGILCLVPLLAMRSSRYAQEHAKQGLVLLIVWVVGSLVFWFPLVGWALGLAVLVANIVALLKCLSGEFWEIPVVGKYRSKINL